MVSGHGHSSDAKAMGFLKILPKDHLQGEEFMVIASNFEMENKIILPNPLCLTLPNGAEWRVSWIKRNYDIWFQKDWKKFAMDCSLRDPHLLVFKYEGGPHFEVRIFDVITCNEIDYSSIRCTNDATNRHYNEVESDHSVEILESDDESAEILENGIHTLLPKKRKTNTKGEQHGSDINLHCKSKGVPSRRKLNRTKNNVDFDAIQQNVSSGARRVRGGGMINANSCSKCEATPIQKELVMDKARDYMNKTKNPGFIQPLFPAYMDARRDVLGIKRAFVRECLDGFEGKATIGVPYENRTWPVWIKINHGNGQTSITSGWKSFWQHYKLKVDDVCVFEMTQLTPLSFKVIIFPAREVPEELQGYGNDNEANQLNQHSPERGNSQFGKRKRSEGNSRSWPKTGVLGNYGSSSVEENKFKIHIRNYHLKNPPNLPKDFFKRYPRCEGKDVKLQVGEEWWLVKVRSCPYRSFGRFSGGWCTFVRECKLEVENNWEFDMIDKENLVLKVSISN